MAVPQGVLWDRDPHTEAKHQLLKGYLDAWFPILASSHPKSGVTFADAFAGPGEYLGGAIGSPIIAIHAAVLPAVQLQPTPIRLVFVEKDEARFNHLKVMVSKIPLPSNCIVSFLNGSCESVLIPGLTSVNAQIGPIFVNCDGWGVDTPFALVEEVGRSKSAEVMVTFGSQWFTRFAGQEEVVAGDQVFGSSEWRQVTKLSNPTEKKRFLVNEYRHRLSVAGFPLHLTFELVDEGGHPLFLVFGTASELGVEKMKESMWRVDSVSGSKFRDPRDPNQLTFDLSDAEPDFRLLSEQILEYLGTETRSMAELQRFTLLETVFKKAHAKRVVDQLEVSKRVHCIHARSFKDYKVTATSATLF